MKHSLLNMLASAWSPSESTEQPATEASSSQSTDDELVTRERTVIDHLRDSDGHAWQGEVSAACGWSDSKTSRVLSDMEADGLITRYRVGRRKVVYLPSSEPSILQQGTAQT